MSRKAQELYTKAKLDPAVVFASPEKLLTDPVLSPDLKIDLLRRWAYDAKRMNDADFENMSGGNDVDLYDRIIQALHTLGAGLNEDWNDPA